MTCLKTGERNSGHLTRYTYSQKLPLLDYYLLLKCHVINLSVCLIIYKSSVPLFRLEWSFGQQCRWDILVFMSSSATFWLHAQTDMYTYSTYTDVEWHLLCLFHHFRQWTLPWSPLWHVQCFWEASHWFSQSTCVTSDSSVATNRNKLEVLGSILQGFCTKCDFSFKSIIFVCKSFENNNRAY